MSTLCANKTMSLIYCQFIHLATILLSFCALCQCLKDNSFVCQKITNCQCVFPVGAGIDLTGLEDSTKSPWIKATGKDVTLLFQPCTSIPLPYPDTNECSVTGTALCLYNAVLKTYKLLGKVEEATFDSRSESDPVYLKYNHNSVTTTIELKCGSSSTDPTTLNFEPTSTNTSYVLTLQSPKACLRKMDVDDHSLSAGSVLVIIFFTFSAVYFIGGALAMKLMRGAEGKELIPNYDFWSGLPLLVKDGAFFALSGFQGITSYDRI